MYLHIYAFIYMTYFYLFIDLLIYVNSMWCVCMHIYLIHILVYLYIHIYPKSSCGLLGSSSRRFWDAAQGAGQIDTTVPPHHLEATCCLKDQFDPKYCLKNMIVQYCSCLEGHRRFCEWCECKLRNYIAQVADAGRSQTKCWRKWYQALRRRQQKLCEDRSSNVTSARPVAFLQFLISEMFGWILSNLVFVVLQASPKSPKIRGTKSWTLGLWWQSELNWKAHNTWAPLEWQRQRHTHVNQNGSFVDKHLDTSTIKHINSIEKRFHTDLCLSTWAAGSTFWN